MPRSCPQDIFDPAIVLLTPDSPTAVLESEASDTYNRTLQPGSGLLFSFLGTKGSGEAGTGGGVPGKQGADVGCSVRNVS